MRPLEELEPAVAARLVGLVFDVDDTLTRDGLLELPALQALWLARQAGLRLLAVTGRPLGWAEVIACQWPIDLAVGENGAGWIARDPRGIPCEGRWDPAGAAAWRDVLERIRTAVARELPQVRLAADQQSRRCDLAFDVGERERLDPATVARLVALIEAGGAQALVSSIHAHAAPGGFDKALGVVRAAREVLGADLDRERDRWLFVGDSGNDAAAFAWFPVSAGVANVREHLARLPVPPAYVTRSDRGRGFAELVDTVLERRR